LAIEVSNSVLSTDYPVMLYLFNTGMNNVINEEATVQNKGTYVYLTYSEKRLTGLITTCLGTALQNTLLKKRWKVREDEEEYVSSH
jgi:hypothetical protein